MPRRAGAPMARSRGGRFAINVKPKRKMVRCLGPGKEHYFASDNPIGHRVCSRCRDFLEGMGRLAFARGTYMQGDG